jgi:CubicO group peptidase (beta-lactamase class C family)
MTTVTGLVRLCAAGLALAAVAVLGAQEPSSKAASDQLARWIETFNAGDREAWQRFLSRFVAVPPGPFVDQNLALRRQTGGFELVRVESAEATQVVAVVRERDSEATGARLTIQVEDAAPNRIVQVGVQPGLRLQAQVARLTARALPGAIAADLARRVAADRFSGAVLVAKNGVPVFSSAAGEADLERRVPNRLDTRFRNGSMNKMFTAVAVLSLVQAGKVALQEPLATYLPDYPDPSIARKITIHQLLTHTAGTGDVFGPDLAAHRDELRRHGDYIARFGRQPLLFEPGARWMYSNYGFILLGAVIERVSGQNYYDYVRSHVYARAGMTDTGSEPEAVDVPRRATGYMMAPDGRWTANAPTLPYRGTAAGGGYTTVTDLMRFADALVHHRLLDVATTQLLLTGRVEGAGGRYGYGFIEHVSKGVRSVGHGGNAPGMDGDLQIFPDSGYVVAVLANVDPPAAQRVSEFIGLRVPAR